MVLSDRIAVMKDGVVQQFAPPMAVYTEPANQFVAGLHRQPANELLARQSRGRGEADEIVVGVRPHDLQPAARAMAAGVLSRRAGAHGTGRAFPFPRRHESPATSSGQPVADPSGLSAGAKRHPLARRAERHPSFRPPKAARVSTSNLASRNRIPWHTISF